MEASLAAVASARAFLRAVYIAFVTYHRRDFVDRRRNAIAGAAHTTRTRAAPGEPAVAAAVVVAEATRFYCMHDLLSPISHHCAWRCTTGRNPTHFTPLHTAF